MDNEPENAEQLGLLDAAPPALKVLPFRRRETPPEPEAPAQARRQLAAPYGTTKSMVRALGCPAFFCGQYLQPDAVARGESPLANCGTEFHAWRQDYINHLAGAQLSSDPEWREGYLATTAVLEETREMIARDNFAVDPQTIYGCELRLSIDHEGKPLEHRFGGTPGAREANPATLARGDIDLLLLSDRSASIIDYKSGWSTNTVTDTEPIYYAGLVLCHFPTVEEIHFTWDFTRKGLVRRAAYTRGDLPWILRLMHAMEDRKNEIVEQWNRGLPMPAEPLAGNCPYCQLTCPLRPRWEARDLDIGPAQTEDDVVRLARIRLVCDTISARIGRLVIDYLDKHKGPVDLGMGWSAFLKTSDKTEIPLLKALRALGLDIVDIRALQQEMVDAIAEARPKYSPDFDIPLESLTIGGLSGFWKTKRSKKRPDGGGVSRTEMRQLFLDLADRSAATTLCISKQKPGEIQGDAD